MRVGPAVGWIFLGLFFALPLRGQEPLTIGKLWIGAHGGATDKTSLHECPSGTPYFLGGHVRYEILRFVSVEGGVTLHNYPSRGGSSENHCGAVFGPLPPFFTGNIEVVDLEATGHPSVSSEVRLVLQTPEGARPSGFRLIGGGGWMVGKNIPFLLAGLGLHFGGDRMRGTVDVEQWRFDAPFKRIVSRYENANLVSREEIPGESSERMTTLRVGFRWKP